MRDTRSTNFQLLHVKRFAISPRSLSLSLFLVLQFFHLCIHSVVRGVVNFTDSVYRRHGYSRGIETREGEAWQKVGSRLGLILIPLSGGRPQREDGWLAKFYPVNNSTDVR